MDDNTKQTIPDCEIILKRLEKVESQNRLFKIVGIGIIIVLMVSIIHSLIPVSIIKAERYIICDNQGKEYGWLGIEKDLPILSFTGENFHTSLEPSMLRLKYGHSGSGLFITTDGLSAYNFEKKDNLQLLMLHLGSDDNLPYLSLSGNDRKIRLDCKEPSLSFSGKEPHITMDGDKYGISLYTNEVAGTNEPLGIIVTKWQQGIKKSEVYWRSPLHKISK